MSFKNIDLLPCPFCGAEMTAATSHSDGCYLKLMDELRETGGSDVLVARKLAVAWNQRKLPEGYKIISRVVPDDFGRRWQAARDKDEVGSLSYDNALLEYRRIFNLQKDLWDIGDGLRSN